MTGQGKYHMLLLAIFIMATIGCSHKTLSIFFDGVPDNSDSTITATATVPVAEDNAVQDNTMAEMTDNKSSFHSPFTNKECSSCHDKQAMGQYVESQPGMCYQCHDNFSNMYTNLHAPVDAGSCTECHNPHQSQYPKLLKADERTMCLSCHDNTEDKWISIHEGIENASCSECHNPHGSNDNALLK